MQLCISKTGARVIEVFGFFVRSYKIGIMLSVLLIIAGVLGLSSLKRETFPPVEFPRVTITTLYPGASPVEVEEKITQKIEDEIRSVEGVKDVRSISQSGRSEVQIRIDIDNADIEKAVSDLQSAVQRVTDLPTDILADPKFNRANSKEIPVFELAVIGDNNNRLRDRTADQLKRLIEDVDSVSNVRLVGFNEREFQILLDPQKMRYLNVGIEEVFRAVRLRAQNIPAGFVRAQAEQRLVRVKGQVDQASEMGEILVRSNFSGRSIQIKDIATVKDSEEDSVILARLDNQPATLLVVTKKGDADSVETVDLVKQKLTQFNKTLPDGIQVKVFNNEAERVKRRLDIVISNAVSGLILVLVVLLIFLPGVLGVMTALTLPLTVLGTVALMPQLGANFNIITMLALVIAIGMLVDNSVVISENYAQLRKEGLSINDAAIKAAHQFWLPITATGLTTVAAFLPMLVTKGVLGDFIRWIPIVVTIALVMSLFESFFLLPARLIFTLRDKSSSDAAMAGTSWFDGIRDKFENLMETLIHRRYLVFFGITGLLLGSIVLSAVGNRFELFPPDGVEFYFARVELESDATLKKTDEVTQKLTQRVQEVLGDNLKHVIQRAGIQTTGPGDPTEKNGDSVAMLTLVIDEERAKTLNTQKTLNELRKIEIAGAKSVSFESASGGPPVGKALTVTLRAQNEQELKGIVSQAVAEIAKINGSFDVSSDLIDGGPEYRLQIDFATLAKLGLSIDSVGFALRTALQGSIASEMSMDNKDFNLKIRYSDDNKASIQSLRETPIMSPNGQLISLDKIAEITEQNGPEVKKRYQYMRAITISGNVNPEVISSTELNAQAKVILDRIIGQSATVTYRFGGEEESTQESVQSLFQAMILAFLGIFTILVFMFQSFTVPILILTSIPLGLVGVLWAFFLHGRPLSFIALIGVIGLAGVVVNSAIILMSYIEELLEKKNVLQISMNRLLAKASADRLRAVLVTSLTTVGGLMPTAYSIGGSDPILVPMTLALAWGLVSGTFLTIIWVPVSYAIFQDLFSWFASRRTS